MYRRQLAWRRDAGLLPQQTEFLVLPDPGGRRIGSGGATLRALAHEAVPSPRIPDSTPRVLIIHSGGDSKRLPHCSAVGKLFARVPRTLPDGRASTIFDEFLISLSGLAANAPGGALIASGDVLLVFDHLQLSFQRRGAIGVAAAAPAAMGRRHGVYVSEPGGGQVRAYLHKPDAAELAHWDAVEGESVPIDTGLVWLDAGLISQLVALATDETIAAAPLNLYGDLLLPLAASTSLERYLADTSDGPATPAVQAARRKLWERLRGTPFSVQRLQPAVFVHFGSSQEYWRMTAGDPALAELCGWEPRVSSWLTGALGPAPSRPGAVPRTRGMTVARAGDRTPDFGDGSRLILINSVVEGPVPRAPSRCSCPTAMCAGPLSWHGRTIIVGVDTARPLDLAPDTVLDQLPLAGGGYVTRLFGLLDDPKRGWDDPAATFVNRSLAAWAGGGRRHTRSPVARRGAGRADAVECAALPGSSGPRRQPGPGVAAAGAGGRTRGLGRTLACRAAPVAGRELRHRRR